MKNICIREPTLADEEKFLSSMKNSQTLHHPWTKSPLTHDEFIQYINRGQQTNQKCFLICNKNENIVGVFNVSEIIRGCFQSAYLGFYGVSDFTGQGYMSAGLKLVLENIFTELKLHRIEANIQPENILSINLVKNNGFKKEGYSSRYLQIDGEWRDHERWALTIEDYMTKINLKKIESKENTTLKIIREENPNSNDVQILNDGIIEYAKQQRNHKPFRPFAFFIRDEKENIKGGCNGVTLYGCLHVDSLWVHESLRGSGYGKKLMAEVENTAKENNCPFMTVFTMDWEALDFYTKLGFYVEFERHGYDKKSIFYFLRKDL